MFLVVIACTPLQLSWASDCAACGDEPRFPEAAAILDAYGLSSDQYSVLLTWNETAPNDNTVIVSGYHVKGPDGEVFDLYVDSHGSLLSDAQLKALDVHPKDWSLRPLEAGAQIGAGAVKSAYPAVEPMGVRKGVSPTAVLQLSPIDIARIEREDAQKALTTAKGVTRIGVFQLFSEPVAIGTSKATHGEWVPIAGGRIWSITIVSPKARGQRIHFAELNLPTSAQLTVYNKDNVTEAYVVPRMDVSDVWSPTCFAESVVVEVFVPDDAPEDLSLVIDRTGHIYKDFSALAWAKGTAGACNLDVTCYPDWADTATGVGGLGTIGASGVLWCTGTLIVDTDLSTDIPYFLTAHHCVGTQAKASTIEVYWLYQTPTCNGAPPAPATVPRTTGGADYLAGSGGSGVSGGGNDFTLLRLRQAPPDGLTHVGWSNLAPPVGTPVTVVHHPSGDFKRISFGDITDDANPFADLYHEITYNLGTTEPGSSGSPIMLTATQQIIGQLWGGSASCSLPDAPDYYGRFDVTLPIVLGTLDPGSVTPSVNFSDVSYTFDEAEMTVDITVELDRLPAETITVDFETSPGTGAPGVDYETTSGTLTFLSTQQTQTFPVTIHFNADSPDDNTVVLTLSNPSGCAIGMVNPATLTIVDAGPPPEVSALSIPFFVQSSAR